MYNILLPNMAGRQGRGFQTPEAFIPYSDYDKNDKVFVCLATYYIHIPLLCMRLLSLLGISASYLEKAKDPT